MKAMVSARMLCSERPDVPHALLPDDLIGWLVRCACGTSLSRSCKSAPLYSRTLRLCINVRGAVLGHEISTSLKRRGACAADRAPGCTGAGTVRGACVGSCWAAAGAVACDAVWSIVEDTAPDVTAAVCRLSASDEFICCAAWKPAAQIATAAAGS